MEDAKTFLIPNQGSSDDFAKLAMLNNGGMNGWNNNPLN